MKAEAHFWLRRLHSLSGVVPIGGFLAFHLYENFTATRGAEAYNETSRRLQEMPLSLLLEIAVIAVPIFFHGIYGLFITAESRPNPIASAFLRNALYTLQRVTGVIVFAFILFHLWTTRLVQLDNHESLDLFFLVRSTIANPWLYAFYVAGIVSATFHFAYGLSTFAIVWGITVGPKAQRRMIGVSAAVFVILSAVGVRSIAAFRI